MAPKKKAPKRTVADVERDWGPKVEGWEREAEDLDAAQRDMRSRIRDVEGKVKDTQLSIAFLETKIAVENASLVEFTTKVAAEIENATNDREEGMAVWNSGHLKLAALAQEMHRMEIEMKTVQKQIDHVHAAEQSVKQGLRKGELANLMKLVSEAQKGCERMEEVERVLNAALGSTSRTKHQTVGGTVGDSASFLIPTSSSSSSRNEEEKFLVSSSLADGDGAGTGAKQQHHDLGFRRNLKLVIVDDRQDSIAGGGKQQQQGEEGSAFSRVTSLINLLTRPYDPRRGRQQQQQQRHLRMRLGDLSDVFMGGFKVNDHESVMPFQFLSSSSRNDNRGHGDVFRAHLDTHVDAKRQKVEDMFIGASSSLRGSTADDTPPGDEFIIVHCPCRLVKKSDGKKRWSIVLRNTKNSNNNQKNKEHETQGEEEEVLVDVLELLSLIALTSSSSSTQTATNEDGVNRSTAKFVCFDCWTEEDDSNDDNGTNSSPSCGDGGGGFGLIWCTPQEEMPLLFEYNNNNNLKKKVFRGQLLSEVVIFMERLRSSSSASSASNGVCRKTMAQWLYSHLTTYIPSSSSPYGSGNQHGGGCLVRHCNTITSSSSSSTTAKTDHPFRILFRTVADRIKIVQSGGGVREGLLPLCCWDEDEEEEVKKKSIEKKKKKNLLSVNRNRNDADEASSEERFGTVMSGGDDGDTKRVGGCCGWGWSATATTTTASSSVSMEECLTMDEEEGRDKIFQVKVASRKDSYSVRSDDTVRRRIRQAVIREWETRRGKHNHCNNRGNQQRDDDDDCCCTSSSNIAVNVTDALPFIHSSSSSVSSTRMRTQMSFANDDDDDDDHNNIPRTTSSGRELVHVRVTLLLASSSSSLQKKKQRTDESENNDYNENDEACRSYSSVHQKINSFIASLSGERGGGMPPIHTWKLFPLSKREYVDTDPKNINKDDENATECIDSAPNHDDEELVFHLEVAESFLPIVQEWIRREFVKVVHEDIGEEKVQNQQQQQEKDPMTKSSPSSTCEQEEQEEENCLTSLLHLHDVIVDVLYVHYWNVTLRTDLDSSHNGSSIDDDHHHHHHRQQQQQVVGAVLAPVVTPLAKHVLRKMLTSDHAAQTPFSQEVPYFQQVRDLNRMEQTLHCLYHHHDASLSGSRRTAAAQSESSSAAASFPWNQINISLANFTDEEISHSVHSDLLLHHHHQQQLLLRNRRKKMNAIGTTGSISSSSSLPLLLIWVLPSSSPSSTQSFSPIKDNQQQHHHQMIQKNMNIFHHRERMLSRSKCGFLVDGRRNCSLSSSSSSPSSLDQKNDDDDDDVLVKIFCGVYFLPSCRDVVSSALAPSSPHSKHDDDDNVSPLQLDHRDDDSDPPPFLTERLMKRLVLKINEQRASSASSFSPEIIGYIPFEHGPSSSSSSSSSSAEEGTEDGGEEGVVHHDTKKKRNRKTALHSVVCRSLQQAASSEIVETLLRDMMK